MVVSLADDKAHPKDQGDASYYQHSYYIADVAPRIVPTYLVGEADEESAANQDHQATENEICGSARDSQPAIVRAFAHAPILPRREDGGKVISRGVA